MARVMSAAVKPWLGHWWESALCRRYPADWWVQPDRPATSGSAAANQRALAICRQCPVRRPCLDDAIAQKVVGVIRGGERMPGQLTDWTAGRKQPPRVAALLDRWNSQRGGRPWAPS